MPTSKFLKSICLLGVWAWECRSRNFGRCRRWKLSNFVQSMFRPFIVNNLGGLFFINLISCDDPPSDWSKKNPHPKKINNFGYLDFLLIWTISGKKDASVWTAISAWRGLCVSHGPLLMDFCGIVGWVPQYAFIAHVLFFWYTINAYWPPTLLEVYHKRISGKWPGPHEIYY